MRYNKLHTNKLNNLEEMDKLFKTYNLPTINCEEIKYINRSITNIETESVITNFQTKKKPQDQMTLLVILTKHKE